MEETIKEPVEQLIEKPIEESKEELVEEVKEGQIEELAEKPIEKPVEELVEKPIEESTEELIEKQEEEPVGELTEKQIEEPIVEAIEKPIDELVEEVKEGQVEELVEKSIEESTKESTGKFIKNRKKIVLGIIISFCTLLVIYFGMTKYFTKHFYFGSKINSFDVSGKTVEDAKIAVSSELQNYTLNLKERDGKSEPIKASDVGLRVTSEEEFNKLKDNQNPFKWVLALFTSKDSEMTVGLSYDEKILMEQVDKLSCFKSENIVEPKNPSFQYQDNNYVIIKEVIGNKVNKDVLYSNVVNSMLKIEPEIDLEAVGSYINPQYTSESEKTIEDKDILNKYVSSKITYAFGEIKETLDGSTINTWLKVNENFQVVFDEEKVSSYIDKLAETYDTVGKVRTFATSSGTTINIGGGDYGWAIDRTKEIENLIKDIQEGKTVTKQPVFSQTTPYYSKNDIGNTYVEIDLIRQHLWFYKNGALVVQGDVVTGNVSSSHSTPGGIYSLKYKERNAILRGPGYAAPVSFWMPFNDDIGIHDATWRGAFGGNIYWTNGSHGCVNAPYYLANTIFDNIDEGTPIICY